MILLQFLNKARDIVGGTTTIERCFSREQEVINLSFLLSLILYAWGNFMHSVTPQAENS